MPTLLLNGNSDVFWPLWHYVISYLIFFSRVVFKAGRILDKKTFQVEVAKAHIEIYIHLMLNPAHRELWDSDRRFSVDQND